MKANFKLKHDRKLLDHILLILLLLSVSIINTIKTEYLKSSEQDFFHYYLFKIKNFSSFRLGYCLYMYSNMF